MAEGLAGLIGAYGSDEEEQMEEEAGGQVTILGRSEEDEDMQGLDLSHLTTGAALAELDTAATQQAVAGPTQQPGVGGRDEELPDAATEAQPPTDGDAQQLAAAAEPAVPSTMLPPDILEPPPGECPPATQKKVASWVAVSRARGLSLNGELRKSRPYRNPEFFSKMVQHEGIFEYGSCFAPEVFDPQGLPKEDYVDALQKEWAAEEERRKAVRQQTGRIEFAKSGSQPNLAHNPLLPGLNPGVAAGVGVLPGVPLRPGVHPAVQHVTNTAAAVAAAQLKAAQLAAGMAGGGMVLPAAPAPGAGKSKWDAPRR